MVIGQPKSESSQRTIPLPDSVAALCEQFDPGDPEACGLEGVHFHTLRQSFATRCMEVKRGQMNRLAAAI